MKKTLWLLLIAALPTAQVFAAPPPQAIPAPRWLRRAQDAGVNSLHKKAYEQLAQMRMQRRGWLNQPLQNLQKMGIDVLPVLAEALNDNTVTLAKKDGFDRPHGVLDTKPTYYKVNELLVKLIPVIAEHSFVIGKFPKDISLWDAPQHPEVVSGFQALVLDWYTKNGSKTLTQRKIDDLSDPWFRNRLDAAEWLGQNKAVEGKDALERYIDTILAHKANDSLTESELTAAAAALGKIGDKSALPAVQRVHNHFLNYKRIGEDYDDDSIARDRMPEVQRALTLLGAAPKA